MGDKKVEKLARFVRYMLERDPDEFGLVTDQWGFVPVADLLKALHEEGFHHVRRNHLERLAYQHGQSVIEFKDHLVRPSDLSRLVSLRETSDGPKLLYASARRRAYETIAAHGLKAQGHIDKVTLFTSQDLAHRVGSRRDSDPVIITVQISKAIASGLRLWQFSERIFLATDIPPEYCRLPRPPRSLKRREQEPPTPPPTPKTPGGYIVNVDVLMEDAHSGKSQGRKRKSKAWKKDRQKERRWKTRRNQSQ